MSTRTIGRWTRTTVVGDAASVARHGSSATRRVIAPATMTVIGGTIGNGEITSLTCLWAGRQVSPFFGARGAALWPRLRRGTHGHVRDAVDARCTLPFFGKYAFREPTSCLSLSGSSAFLYRSDAVWVLPLKSNAKPPRVSVGAVQEEPTSLWLLRGCWWWRSLCWWRGLSRCAVAGHGSRGAIVPVSSQEQIAQTKDDQQAQNDGHHRPATVVAPDIITGAPPDWRSRRLVMSFLR